MSEMPKCEQCGKSVCGLSIVTGKYTCVDCVKRLLAEKDKRIAELEAKLSEIRRAAEPAIEALFVWGSDTKAERLQAAIDLDKAAEQK